MSAKLLKDISDDEYNEIDAIRATMLKNSNKHSMMTAYRMSLNSPDSPALTFGRMFHCLSLIPDRFEQEFFVLPKLDLRKPDHKMMKADIIRQNRGKQEVSKKDHEAAVFMANRLRESDNVDIQDMFKDSIKECAILWDGKLAGITCKVKIDMLCDDKDTGFIADIKTASAVEPAIFQKDAMKYGYHIQAALYQEGVYELTGLRLPFFFIVISKDKFGEYAIDKADEEFIKYGRYIMEEELEKWNKAVLFAE